MSSLELSWGEGLVLIFGTAACLKSRGKVQAGKKILGFIKRLILKREAHQLCGTMCCCLHIEENKMTVLSLLEMVKELNAAL